MKDQWSLEEANQWLDEDRKKVQKRSSDKGELRMSFDDGFPRLIGRAVPYGEISLNPIPENRYMKEKIKPGAFKRSIEEDEILCLWDHEMKYVLGRKGNGSLKLSENESGVYFECIPPDSTWAKDLVTSIKRQDINSMSFSFSIYREAWEKENGRYIRNVNEGKLHEISVTTFPVYTGSQVVARASEILIWDGTEVSEEDAEKLKLSEADIFNKLEALNKKIYK